MKEEDQKILIAFGKKLAQLRTDRGLSQQDLANKCRMDRRKISKIENGELNSRLYTHYVIANALEIEVQELFGEL